MKKTEKKIIKYIGASFFLLLAIILFSQVELLHSDKEKKDTNSSVRDSKTGFTFSAVGDYGATHATTEVLSLVEKLGSDFHILLGDLSYKDMSPEDKWCRFVSSFTGHIPLVLVPGNHESDGKDGHIDNFQKCMPFSLKESMKGVYAKEYYFDYPESKPLARFIQISPNLNFRDEQEVSYLPDSKHFLWLKDAIESARSKNIPWVIVSMHKPCINSEKKDCEIGFELPNFLISEGVDLVLSGHAHLYDRTEQLSCVREKADKSCIKKESKEGYQKDAGTIFVTAGTGGTTLRDTSAKKEQEKYFAKSFGKNRGGFHGVSQVFVTPDMLEVKFFESKQGTEKDSFIIKSKI